VKTNPKPPEKQQQNTFSFYKTMIYSGSSTRMPSSACDLNKQPQATAMDWVSTFFQK
jgi:hypothetical protein